MSVFQRPVPKMSATSVRVSEFKSHRVWKLYGSYVAEARRARGLTIRDLSEKLDVPFQTLNRLELGGAVRRHTLMKVERWLRRLGEDRKAARVRRPGDAVSQAAAAERSPKRAARTR